MGRKAHVDRSPEEKWQIVQEGIKSGNISETCRRYQIAPTLFYRWKDEAEHIRLAVKHSPIVRRTLSMPKNQEREYQVGFGKPPRQNQFRKGASGNPKGRPRGRRNLATVLEKALQERVVINENGSRKTITKLEAAVKQLVNRAASGDLAAMRQLSALAGSGADQAAVPPSPEFGRNDQKVMASMLKRLEASG
jgi:hypothetical protein